VIDRRAWLYKIATNLALNAVKRRNRFAWLPWFSLDIDHPAPDDTEHVGERSVVETALGEVSPTYRAPLLLYCHYGLSTVEVARALGINEGAARTRIYRAREMFRQAYERGNAA